MVAAAVTTIATTTLAATATAPTTGEGHKAAAAGGVMVEGKGLPKQNERKVTGEMIERKGSNTFPHLAPTRIAWTCILRPRPD
jgi:hypothetical protein